MGVSQECCASVFFQIVLVRVRVLEKLFKSFEYEYAYEYEYDPHECIRYATAVTYTRVGEG